MEFVWSLQILNTATYVLAFLSKILSSLIQFAMPFIMFSFLLQFKNLPWIIWDYFVVLTVCSCIFLAHVCVFWLTAAMCFHVCGSTCVYVYVYCEQAWNRCQESSLITLYLVWGASFSAEARISHLLAELHVSGHTHSTFLCILRI